MARLRAENAGCAELIIFYVLGWLVGASGGTSVCESYISLTAGLVGRAGGKAGGRGILPPHTC